ncbi:MAG: DUF2905 domain-containing protein [Runella sp.]
MNAHIGKWLIIGGLFLVAVGVIVYFFHDKLKWIGHLPGDIRIENGNTRIYFPITTMILLSLLLSLISNLLKRFF